jgi:hypothetical protein
LMIVLTVQIDEKVADGLQDRERHRSVIDKTTIMPFGRYLSSQEQVVRELEVLRFDKVADALVAGDPKHGFDNGLVGSPSDDFRARSLSKDQAQGVDENGLAGTRFTRDDIQATLEFDFNLFDECVVLYEKGLQHRGNVFLPRMYRKKSEFPMNSTVL